MEMGIVMMQIILKHASLMEVTVVDPMFKEIIVLNAYVLMKTLINICIGE